MHGILSDLESNIAFTRAMKLSEKHALEYLEHKGYPIKHAYYWRVWGTIQSRARERAFEIAKNFTELHINRLDKFYTIEEEMWLQYHQETKPYLKAKILAEIAKIQSPIAALEEATQLVLETGLSKGQTEGIGEILSAVSTLEKG